MHLLVHVHVNYNNTPTFFYSLIESILQMHNPEEGNFIYNFVNQSSAVNG